MEFLQVVVFQVTEVGSLSLTTLVCDELESLGVLEVHFVTAKPVPIPEGPYVSGLKGIYKVWRLVPDFNRAFIVSTIPDARDRTKYK